MTQTIFRKNDNVISWQWMTQASDGAYVNNGIVTFTLYSGYALDPVTGDRLPSSGDVNLVVYGPSILEYIAGSDGKYQGKLPASVDLDLSKSYTIEINAASPVA